MERKNAVTHRLLVINLVVYILLNRMLWNVLQAVDHRLLVKG